MDTLKNIPKESIVNSFIGSNNENVHFYNYDENSTREIMLLKVENEKLRGLLDLAMSQLSIKDSLIKVFIL